MVPLDVLSVIGVAVNATVPAVRLNTTPQVEQVATTELVPLSLHMGNEPVFPIMYVEEALTENDRVSSPDDESR